jgi:hypothetical protein
MTLQFNTVESGGRTAAGHDGATGRDRGGNRAFDRKSFLPNRYRPVRQPEFVLHIFNCTASLMVDDSRPGTIPPRDGSVTYVHGADATGAQLVRVNRGP